MKFKDLFNSIIQEEEKIPKAFEYKKICASHSYYFLYSSFKVLVLLKKDGLENNKRHWASDELIGNSLEQLVVYYEGTLTPKEIYDSFMLNFENNYTRLLKDLKQYKKFLNKEDTERENVLEIANNIYSSFSKWIVTIKNNLKAKNTFEYKLNFYNNNY